MSAPADQSDRSPPADRPKRLDAHDLARVLPPMSREEFDGLKKSISENGLREPIVLFEGKILDGRHRYAACLEVGVEPTTREFDPQGDWDAAVTFVTDANLHRRHLEPAQRVALFLKLFDVRPPGRPRSRPRRQNDAPRSTVSVTEREDLSRKELVERSKASWATVVRVLSIRRDDPDLLDQVAAGKMTAREAERESGRRRAEKNKDKVAARALKDWNKLPAAERRRRRLHFERFETSVAKAGDWIGFRFLSFVRTDKKPYPDASVVAPKRGTREITIQGPWRFDLRLTRGLLEALRAQFYLQHGITVDDARRFAADRASTPGERKSGV